MFHTHVESVLSVCCTCFTHMLQQYVSNVSSMFDVCCIQVFMLQVFHRDTMSDGCIARAPGGWATFELGTGERGCSELGAGS
jgi:hypothetical protein